MKMSNYNDETWSNSVSEQERKILNQIMREFALISDVNGVALAKTDGSDVFCCEYEDRKLEQFIHSFLKLISKDPYVDIKSYKHGMFIQSIIDMNGRKILLARLRSDWLVMCILDENAYLGLAMLVLEGLLREIDGLLNEDT
jgi:predicted regulator of Ras-like GTPase activity (Roadblock/LC7/MglB family)